MSFARVRALVVVGVLAVAAVVFVIVALVRDTQQNAVANGCPKGAVLADVTLPDDSDQVSVKVYNGTNKPNLAEQATNDFKNRGFKTQKPAESKKKYTGVAELRYGPAAVGKAHLLKAYFLAQGKDEYDPKRKGDLVDVVLGSKYLELATQTEVNQSLVELGEPDVPPGACAAPAKKAAKQ